MTINIPFPLKNNMAIVWQMVKVVP